MVEARESKRVQGRDRDSVGRRLVGWLVSYADDEQGFSFELRTGRSFISSDNMGETTLRVDIDDVDAPHAAIKASRRHSVTLQDVFSRNGTYHTRVDADRDTRLTAPVSLEHGDWIRVGENARFQVVLIDGPGK